MTKKIENESHKCRKKQIRFIIFWSMEGATRARTVCRPRALSNPSLEGCIRTGRDCLEHATDSPRWSGGSKTPTGATHRQTTLVARPRPLLTAIVLGSCIRPQDVAYKIGIPVVLENPDTSRLWNMPNVVWCFNACHANFIRSDYCQDGTLWRKRTKLMIGNLNHTSDIGILCTGRRAKFLGNHRMD